MKDLFNLLQRFSKSLNKDALLKEKIAQIISHYIKINLPPDNLNLKEGVLEISASPIVKNEIKLKEEKILSELREVSSIIYR